MSRFVGITLSLRSGLLSRGTDLFTSPTATQMVKVIFPDDLLVQYFRPNTRLLLDRLWKSADFVQSERPFPA